jgi:hypothetical protein
MEPEGSLPHSQEPATCPYPELYVLYAHCMSMYIRRPESKDTKAIKFFKNSY